VAVRPYRPWALLVTVTVEGTQRSSNAFYQDGVKVGGRVNTYAGAWGLTPWMTKGIVHPFQNSVLWQSGNASQHWLSFLRKAMLTILPSFYPTFACPLLWGGFWVVKNIFVFAFPTSGLAEPVKCSAWWIGEMEYLGTKSALPKR
jgi:hypothetical protein